MIRSNEEVSCARMEGPLRGHDKALPFHLAAVCCEPGVDSAMEAS